MRPTSHRRERQRGTAVVELAIVLPLLVFLGLMAGEGAGVLRAHQVLNNAAREGAHLSAMPENRCNGSASCITAIQQAVVDYAARNALTINTGNVGLNQSVLITFPGGTTARGSQVVVTYSYPLRFLSAVPFFSVPKNLTLQNAAEFRNLY